MIARINASSAASLTMTFPKHLFCLEFQKHFLQEQQQQIVPDLSSCLVIVNLDILPAVLYDIKVKK